MHLFSCWEIRCQLDLCFLAGDLFLWKLLNHFSSVYWSYFSLCWVKVCVVYFKFGFYNVSITYVSLIWKSYQSFICMFSPSYFSLFLGVLWCICWCLYWQIFFFHTFNPCIPSWCHCSIFILYFQCIDLLQLYSFCYLIHLLNSFFFLRFYLFIWEKDRLSAQERVWGREGWRE